MAGRIDGWMNGWMGGWMDGRTDRQTDISVCGNDGWIIAVHHLENKYYLFLNK
jgi:hypothetical protein